MIRTLANKTTAAVYRGHYVHTLPRNIQPVALRKLDLLDAAASLSDLLAPPAGRLEMLRGRRRGQWQLRIEGHWQLCFRFVNGDAFDVEIAEIQSEDAA